MNDNVLCPKGHAARFTNHGPNVGQGWYCPMCHEDVEHSDNVFGLSSKIKKSIEILSRPTNGQQLACMKRPCRACSGVYRNHPKVELKVGDIVTASNIRGTPLLQRLQGYEIVNIEQNGIRIKIMHNGTWDNLAYSACRFIYGGKL